MTTATIRTRHTDASKIAAAVAPDNTTQIETHVEDGTVVTTIERDSTSGVQSTVDDYVVNVDVAATVIERARAFDAETRNERQTETNSETTDTNTRTNTNTQ